MSQVVRAFEFLRQVNKPLTARQVAQQLGTSFHSTRTVLAMLTANGAVSKEHIRKVAHYSVDSGRSLENLTLTLGQRKVYRDKILVALHKGPMNLLELSEEVELPVSPLIDMVEILVNEQSLVATRVGFNLTTYSRAA